MARAKKVSLDFVIEAFDKFSAPFAKFNAKVDAATAAMSRMQATMAKVGHATGLARLSRSVGGLTGSVLDLGGAAVESFGRMTEAVSKFSLLLGGAGGGFVALAKNTADASVEAQRMAQALGVGMADLQKLTYAASQFNVEGDSMHDMLATLTEKIVEADEGSEDLQKMFGALGIKVKDARGQLKTSSQVMLEMADAFAAMQDSSVKTKLAIELFGDEGKRLIPLLNGGRAELARMGAEAEALGLVFGGEAAEQGEAFQRSLQGVANIARGLWNTIGQKLVPILTPLLERFREWLTLNREAIAGRIEEWVQRLADAVPDLVEGFKVWLERGETLLAWGKRFVDFVGGADNALIALVAFMNVPLIKALGAAGAAFLKLGATILTTPVGWLLAGLTAIAALVYQIWKHWEDITGAASNVSDMHAAADELGVDLAEADADELEQVRARAEEKRREREAVKGGETPVPAPSGTGLEPVAGPSFWGPPVSAEAVRQTQTAGMVQRSEHVEKTEIVIRAEKGTEILSAPHADNVTVSGTNRGLAGQYS